VRFADGAGADTRSKARAAVNARLERRLPVGEMQLLSLQLGETAADAAARIDRQPGVEYAEPNWTRHALATVDDPYFPYEWGLENSGQAINGIAGTPDADIDAPEAWDVTTGDPSMTVAVVDTGIDATHPDLSSKIASGWDFVDNDADPTDMNGHGTHVSGTIAAAGNDQNGVAGVAYGSRIMPLRVLDANGQGNVADVIAGYSYAADHGIRVVNASLGSGTSSLAERDAIASAPNTLFVVAAGNGGTDGVGDDVDQTPDYPCAYPLDNIVCVGATDSADQLASFSNFGTVGVDIAAPGVDIASDWAQALGGSYAWLDGTSMATPHVSGTAALVASRFPAGTAADLRRSLLSGADQVAALSGKIAGARRLNAYGAVTALAPAPTPALPPVPPDPAPDPNPDSEAPAPDPPLRAANPAADSAPPRVSVKLSRRVSAASVRRHGVTATLTCSEACRIDARLALGSDRARAASISAGRTTRRLASAGQARITVRPSRRTSRRIHRGSRLRLQLTVRDAAGNTRRVSKSVLLG
jgi:subtilisin family serine protease